MLSTEYLVPSTVAQRALMIADIRCPPSELLLEHISTRYSVLGTLVLGTMSLRLDTPSSS